MTPIFFEFGDLQPWQREVFAQLAAREAREGYAAGQAAREADDLPPPGLVVPVLAREAGVGSWGLVMRWEGRRLGRVVWLQLWTRDGRVLRSDRCDLLWQRVGPLPS